MPNLPEQGRWILVRVKEGAYDFAPVRLSEHQGPDYGHIVPVEPVRDPSGKIGIVDPNNKLVDARLRATVRNLSRMWSIDALGKAVDVLVEAIEKGLDTRRPQPKDEKAETFFEAIKKAAWQEIETKYHAAELEHLVHRVLACIYEGGRVEHWGGVGEKGADLIVYTRDPLGLEYKIGVQVKRFGGVHDDIHALRQIEQAKEHHRIDAGVIVTTAVETSDAFEEKRAELESTLGIDIRVITRDELIELVMKHSGTARIVDGRAIADLLRASPQSDTLQEHTPVTDRVYEEIERLVEVEGHPSSFGVWHQNRGGGSHLIHIEVSGAMTEATVRAVETRLRRLIPSATSERIEVNVAAATTTIKAVVQVPS
ncbi:restriction endonuclease [Polyangium aurulentum]|uniref:restriction endonuclease n=1 Tax=Polyangium aurulentum TaxID=2567896 RepID=UPI00200FA4A7|nr:restriction endonuclease [Polyangium aurulentum]UQA61349.1 restriction endonuclease [Polyangium aurulentum]